LTPAGIAPRYDTILKRIAHIATLTLIVLLASVIGLYFWQRARTWRMFRRSPDIVNRIKIVPSDLDLSTVELTNTKPCNIGYAEFALPSKYSLALYSYNGTTIIGKSSAFEFIFMPPKNPKGTNTCIHLMKLELSKLPVTHPLVREMSDPQMTDLDFQIRIEKLTALPTLWQCLVIDKASFSDIVGRVLGKSISPYGCDGVYYYKTDATRGLLRKGQSDCHASAHVVIESQTRKNSLIFIINMRNDDASSVMPLLLPILKSFHFTVGNIPSEESLKALIQSTGIEPQPEE